MASRILSSILHAVILHKLVLHHAKHGYDHTFSMMQVDDALEWLKRNGVDWSRPLRVLDLGCGSGTFGGALLQRGCDVIFADEGDWLEKDLPRTRFRKINIDSDSLSPLGRFDLVVCSNVIEHLRHPTRLLASLSSLLEPGGFVYLSWTNWLSPWGGHDFSPFHYLGPGLGPKVFDKLHKRPRLLKPYENLFPTYIGSTLRFLRQQAGIEIVKLAPRYYTELTWLMHLPILREFLAWNCVVLLRRR